MGSNLLHGLTALGNGPSIAYLIGGALIGTIIGVIPGLSTVVVLSIILVFVYHIDLTGTLCLFLGAHAGSYYSASVSSILLNTPAHPEAFPITLDGYPMARKGEPGRALGLSACSTFVGGVLGCVVLVGFVQVLDSLVGVFHPPEYVALVTFAMIMVGTIGADSVGKALTSAGAGLLLSSIGASIITGTERYTFGTNGLADGISLVALALGAFAIPQMVMVFGTGTAAARQDMTGREIGSVSAVELTSGYKKQLIGGVFETFRHRALLLQSGILGGITGMIPGIGGFTGNFLAYGVARQTSKNRHLFGTGTPEGIIAPEGSSLAKEAGHIIPIIGLGIPGGVGGALFIAALTIKDVRTGSGFTTTYPVIPYEIAWIIALAGLIGTIAGLLLGSQIARITKVPGPLLFPFIVALSISGPFLASIQFFVVIEVLAFGVLGLALRRLGYPIAPFVLGLVLGPTFETNVYLTYNIYPGFTFLEKRPLADGIFLLAIIALVSKGLELRAVNKRRREDLASELDKIDDVAERELLLSSRKHQAAPYPLLALVTTLGFLGASIFAIVYGVTKYAQATWLMSVIGAVFTAVPALYILPRDILNYVSYRKLDPAERVKSRTGVGLSTTLAVVGRLVGIETEVLVPDSVEVSPIAADGDPSAVEDRSWRRHGQYRRELVALLWVGALIALCWCLSFAWGSAIFVLAYGLTSTNRYFASKTRVGVFSVLSAAAIYLVTYEMFHLTRIAFRGKL